MNEPRRLERHDPKSPRLERAPASLAAPGAAEAVHSTMAEADLRFALNRKARFMAVARSAVEHRARELVEAPARTPLDGLEAALAELDRLRKLPARAFLEDLSAEGPK